MQCNEIKKKKETVCISVLPFGEAFVFESNPHTLCMKTEPSSQSYVNLSTGIAGCADKSASVISANVTLDWKT